MLYADFREFPFRNCLEIRVALSSGCHLWAKGCKEALFGRLQRSDEDIENPSSYFPNSFSTHSGESECALDPEEGVSAAEFDGPRAAVHRHRLPVAQPERCVPGPYHRGDAVLAGDK
jgi:hypothetical protein